MDQKLNRSSSFQYSKKQQDKKMDELKILIVEDLPADAEIARRFLKKEKISFASRVVDTAEDLKKALTEFKPDLIISDYFMPGFDGMSALKIARSQPRYIPFILLTGSVNEETAVACMKAGADDYVLKEKVRRLPFAVREALQKYKARKEKELAEEKLQSIFRVAPTGIGLTKNRILIEVNPKICEITGYQPQELIGKSARILYPSQKEFELVGKEKYDQIAKQGSGMVETRWQKKDGTIIDILLASTAIDATDLSKGVIFTALDFTERKKESNELLEIKNRYQGLFENSVIGIGIATPEGKIIEVNNAFADMLGYKPTELKSFEVSSLYKNPDERKSVVNLLKQKNSLTDFETKLIRKDGVVIDVLLNISLIKIQGKEFLQTSCQDITDRKQAEETSRESEAKYRLLAENSGDVIFTLDFDLNYTYISPAIYALRGYRPEEVINRNISETLTPASNKKVQQLIEKYLPAFKTAKGSVEPVMVELEALKKDGSTIWVEIKLSVLTDFKGKPDGILGVSRDISERKSTEELLKYHSELQQILLKIASKYINIRVDDFEKSINESLEEMGRFARADRTYIFEYDWENQTMNNIFEWFTDGIEPQIGNLQNVPMKKFPDLIETHKNGNYVYISDVSSLPVKNSLKEHLEMQGIKSLITLPMMDGENCIGFVGFDWVKKHHEYSDEEKILLSLYSRMLVNVKNRLKLENSLITEREKAQAADRLKTAFLNNISHEVRTPLNGILGFGQMMAEADLSKEEKEMYLKILKQSSDRLINTITDFMDISLIASGNVTVNKKIFPVAPLLNELGELYGPQCKEKGLEFEMNLPSDNLIAEVESDPELLKKVFRHLLNNALKFTGEGTIKLGYRLKQDAVECFVEDTGKGIEAEMQDLVFTRFTQEDTRSTRGFEGSGLGLSISKGLMELLGGETALKSEKGKGTTVSITLPRTSEGTEHEKPGNLNQAAGGNVVLIAEDDFVNRIFIETILKGAGIQFISVENGREAVDKCRENSKIGMVLMDLKMPVMDGYEATRLIKEIKPELPIIAITAQAMQGDSEKTINAGCDDYLAKPFKKEKLLAIINSILA